MNETIASVERFLPSLHVMPTRIETIDRVGRVWTAIELSPEILRVRPPLALALARNLDLLRALESKSKSKGKIKSKKRPDVVNSTAVRRVCPSAPLWVHESDSALRQTCPALSLPRKQARRRVRGPGLQSVGGVPSRGGIWLWTILVSLVVALAAPAAETHVLFDFENNFDLVKVQASDARVSLVRSDEGHALRIETGHTQAWPGVTLPAPKGSRNLAAFSSISLQARNAGSSAVTINCRVDNPGADGVKHCVTGSTTVQPGARATIRVELKRAAPCTLEGKLFGLRGYPVATGGDRTIDPRNVTQLMIFLNKPSADHAFEIDDLRAEGVYTAPTAWVTDADPYFPLIDTFGQYQHKGWPGKVHSMSELKQRRDVEADDLVARPGPSDRDRFGGWNGGPQLKATGFFRTEKHGGKWWLVDPEGKLFWSHGIDCVRMQEFTVVRGRESWFQDFPGDRAEFAPFALAQGRVLKGYFAGQSPRCFSFASANLLRKYGDHWRSSSTDLAHRRLRSWGINTIGNWSDEGVRLERRTPYVDSISSGNARRIEGSEGYWGKFPDPFDASFRESLQKSMAAKAGKSAGDPWGIGFFSDNEIAWGDELSLAVATLQSPPDQPAKKEFVDDLKATYGEVAKLNTVWGTTHTSWEAVLQARTAPDKQKARQDLETFYTKIADAYFRTAREAFKQAAPNQLYLGCRFAWGNALAATSAAKFCDVVSYNLYRRSVADFQFNGGADVPLIIGEFHFGALDRGMFHTGLVPTANQAARAQAYSDYVRGALRHPQLVGCHWFQYQDQPTTGRAYDEENYQIGFVDIADTPYPETIATARDVGYTMYSYRLNTSASSGSPAAKSLPNPFFALDTCTKQPYPRSDISPEAQLDLVKELGYAGLSWTVGDPNEARTVTEQAERRALKLFAIYGGATLRADKLEFDPRLLETMKALQGHDTTIWLHITSKEYPKSSPDGDAAAVAGLRELADMAAAHGLRIALYPHTGDWVERVQDAVRVARKVGRKNLGVTFNLCHCLQVGDEEKIPSLLTEAAPHLFLVTINGADRQAAGTGWGRLIQTLDRGSYDLAPLLKQLHSLGFTGPIGLQGYGLKGDRRENLTRSAEAWRKLASAADN